MPVASVELLHKETQFEEMPGWEAVWEKALIGKLSTCHDFVLWNDVFFLSSC